MGLGDKIGSGSSGKGDYPPKDEKSAQDASGMNGGGLNASYSFEKGPAEVGTKSAEEIIESQGEGE